MRDLPTYHAPSPSTASRSSRTRHTAYHARQSVLRCGGPRIHCTQTDTAVVVIPHRRPACSSHSGFHETLTTRLGRPPFGFTNSSHERQCPDHTCRERQGSALKRGSRIRVSRDKPH